MIEAARKVAGEIFWACGNSFGAENSIIRILCPQIQDSQILDCFFWLHFLRRNFGTLKQLGYPTNDAGQVLRVIHKSSQSYGY